MDTKEFLIENNIKPSKQRVLIYDYLKKTHDHPTVDMIYRDLLKIMPNLSKTTIYNTLKLFEKNSIVNEIVIEGSEARYDAIENTHGHFKCLNCNEIYDFFFDLDDFGLKGIDDCQIDTVQFYLKGICKKCKS